jgi:hypothetical protein
MKKDLSLLLIGILSVMSVCIGIFLSAPSHFLFLMVGGCGGGYFVAELLSQGKLK